MYLELDSTVGVPGLECGVPLSGQCVYLGLNSGGVPGLDRLGSRCTWGWTALYLDTDVGLAGDQGMSTRCSWAGKWVYMS